MPRPPQLYTLRFTLYTRVSASRDVSIIAKKPRENQARRNEIMARTKSRRICRADAVGVFRRHAKRRNRRLSVARAVHEPTRSEREGE